MGFYGRTARGFSNCHLFDRQVSKQAYRHIRSFVTIVAILGLTLLAGCHYSQTLSANVDRDTTVTFSIESGAYSEQNLELSLENPSNLPIVYTTDGSIPTASSPRIDGKLHIDSGDTNREFIELLKDEIPDFRTIVVDDTLPTATVIRAAALLPDGTVGPTFTNTYFAGEDIHELFGGIMVISLVADPADLLDYDSGIMAKGAIYDEHRAENMNLPAERAHEVQANYTQKGRDWEREANFELFDSSNELSYEAPCGIRLRGHMSRNYAQKSFNVYFRNSYGMKSMNYPLFGDSATDEQGIPIVEYKSFCLRAGGNDTESLRFRDSLLQQQLKDSGYATQAARPAIVFLNGEFYGVYSLDEKYSDSYIESHYRISSDNVIIFEDGELDEGVDADWTFFDQYRSFAFKDLSDEAIWEEFCATVDVQSMAKYYAFQLYIGNYDLAEARNFRVWRARTSDPNSEHGDTRWRPMAFDLEFSTGLYSTPATRADFDTVEWHLQTCPLFASALENSSFRSMVRSQLVNLSETTFEPERINATFDEWWSTWEPWILMSTKRFNTDFAEAQRSLVCAKEFFSQRAPYIINFFDEHVAEIASGS